MRKASSKNLHQKNKTLSTVVHTDHEQKTTKKSALTKTVSCAKMPISSNIKSSKASLVIRNDEKTSRNDSLVQENKKLR